MKTKASTTFDTSAANYDEWFDRHPGIYQSEILALQKVIPKKAIGLEIGVGTGRFAQPLNILVGVEPSHSMAQLAMSRGITVINARAEALPFFPLSFDFTVMITTDCFLDDIPKAFAEAQRIIKKDGCFIIAMIDKESSLGKKYEAIKENSPWYQKAHFHSVPEIIGLLKQSGFDNFEFWQTLVSNNEHVQEPYPGYGKGGFVVICARKM
jgi:ubiquinone/menaquinone biosynthesis C-methylase UbiE